MDLIELYRRLDEEYDVSGWWNPGSLWEVMIGAILAQRTKWENASRALRVLQDRGLLTVEGIADVQIEELEDLLRPTGLYRQKARYVKDMAMHLKTKHCSEPGDLLSMELGKARKELLSLPGIGPETADVILLLGGQRPRFVAASYVSRTLSRLNIFDSQDYDAVHDHVTSIIPPDAGSYARFYSLLVQHARTVCRSVPRCEECCLRDECPFNE